MYARRNAHAPVHTHKPQQLRHRSYIQPSALACFPYTRQVTPAGSPVREPNPNSHGGLNDADEKAAAAAFPVRSRSPVASALRGKSPKAIPAATPGGPGSLSTAGSAGANATQSARVSRAYTRVVASPQKLGAQASLGSTAVDKDESPKVGFAAAGSGARGGKSAGAAGDQSGSKFSSRRVGVSPHALSGPHYSHNPREANPNTVRGSVASATGGSSKSPSKSPHLLLASRATGPAPHSHSPALERGAAHPSLSRQGSKSNSNAHAHTANAQSARVPASTTRGLAVGAKAGWSGPAAGAKLSTTIASGVGATAPSKLSVKSAAAIPCGTVTAAEGTGGLTTEIAASRAPPTIVLSLSPAGGAKECLKADTQDLAEGRSGEGFIAGVNAEVTLGPALLHTQAGELDGGTPHAARIIAGTPLEPAGASVSNNVGGLHALPEAVHFGNFHAGAESVMAAYLSDSDIEAYDYF